MDLTVPDFCGLGSYFALEVYPVECPYTGPPSAYTIFDYDTGVPNPFNCSFLPGSSFAINGDAIGLDPNNCFPCEGAPTGTITFSVQCNQSDDITFLGCPDPPYGFGYSLGPITGTFEEIFVGNNGSFFNIGIDLDTCCRPSLN